MAAGFPDLNDRRIAWLVEYAREFMRDHEELNRLTEGVDHSPRHLRWCVIDTLSDWYSTPPFLGTSLSYILDKGLFSVFTRGVIIRALESLTILHIRNHLAYSDGGVNVQTENPQLLQAWVNMAKSEYEQKKQRILIALNISQAFEGRGLHSELYFINSFWGDI